MHIVQFNTLFGSELWKRFLILNMLDSKLKAIELENLLLKVRATKDLTFRKLDNTKWTIETMTKEQLEAFLAMTTLGRYTVTVEEENLNSIEGTVVLSFSHEEDGMPRNRRKPQRKKYKERKVDVYEIPSRKLDKKIKVAKITFEGQILPRNIKIEGMNKEVRSYVPKPLQCTKCSRFRHLAKYCRNNEVCAFSSSNSHKTRWNCCAEPKCVNCNDTHHARSKLCEFYNYNVELQLLLNRSILDIRAARKELTIRGFKDPSRSASYRKLVKENSSPQDEEINQDPKVTMINEQNLEENEEEVIQKKKKLK